jgi:single-strand DNA-binding protein
MKITAIGFLGTDPSFYEKKSEDGSDFATFRLAHADRYYNIKDNTWKDVEPIWFTVECFGELARNASARLKKGSSIIVYGNLSAGSWETESGEVRNNLTIKAKSIGIDLNRIE